MGLCMSTLIDGKLLKMSLAEAGGGLHCKLKRAPSTESGQPDSGSTELLRDLPNKLCSNGVTKGCCAHTKQGRKGINQDCFLIWEESGVRGEVTFCGVFDGHGPMGHHVAKEVRECLPNLLLADEQACMCKPSVPLVCSGESNNGTQSAALDSDALAALKKAFVDSYTKMDEKLKAHPQLNCICSGTTAVTLLVHDNDLVIANVGDSRAILAGRREDASLRVQQLTVDFKPNLPGELERIRSCKGRVFALEDEPYVARVWLPNENRPGLAMARALGDFCLKEYGLSAIPHVCYTSLTEHDEFVVLATDGVWDVMSNEEVASVVERAEPKGAAAKNVVDAAVRKWKHKYSHVRMDDCAVVCHFLNRKHTATLSSSQHFHSHSSGPSKEEVVGSTLISYNTPSMKNVVLPCFDRGI